VHVMPLDDQRGGARHHFSIGSGGKGILLEIPAYLRPSEGEQLFFLCFRIHCCTWAYAHLLQPGTLLGLPCCYCCVFHHIIALHHPVGSQTSQKKKIYISTILHLSHLFYVMLQFLWVIALHACTHTLLLEQCHLFISMETVTVTKNTTPFDRANSQLQSSIFQHRHTH